MKGYGLWKGTLTAWDINDARTDPNTPHGHIKYTDDSGRELDCAINVKSSDIVTEVVYWKFSGPDNYFPDTHPIIAKLKALTERRFYEASSPTDSPLGLHIDLLRDGFINLKDGHIPPWNTPGVPNDDIVDFLSGFVQKGVDRNAEVYLFGQQYFPSKNGIHQIHMVQGSFLNEDHPNWQKENGVHQDGGIFLHFADEDKWEAFFIAFASQAWKTDDKTGYPATEQTLGQFLLSGQPPVVGPGEPGEPVEPPVEGSSSVKIQAALVNPDGPDNNPEHELIRVENTGGGDVDISDYFFENQNGATQKLALPNGGKPLVPAGEQVEFLAGKCYLPNNRDGRIMLKNPSKKVVDMVEYRREQAIEGVWIIFRG